MGNGNWDDERDAKRLDFCRIESNLDLLSPETLAEINAAIVPEGHRLEPEAAEMVRADTFAGETDVHYPTDSSLIGYGVRKVLALAVALAGMFDPEELAREAFWDTTLTNA